MRGILCGTTAKTNEEYKIVIKKRMKLMIALSIIGVIIATFGFGAEFYFGALISDKMLGVYLGNGIGFFGAGIILWTKNKLLLNNDEKLRKSRLINSDKRIQEISNKGFRVATYVTIIVLYATVLIGGLYYSELVEIFLFILCTFLLAYAITFKYFSNKI